MFLYLIETAIINDFLNNKNKIMTKLILILAIVTIPAMCFSQTKSQRENEKLQKAWHLDDYKIDTLTGAGPDAASYHLQRAAKDYNISTGIMLIGGGVGIAVAASGNNQAQLGYVAGGAGLLVGLIFRFIGNSEISYAGKALSTKKVSFSGNGVSFNF